MSDWWELLVPGLLPTLMVIMWGIWLDRRSGTDGKLDEIHRRLDGINQTISDLAQRVSRIEGHLKL